MTITLPVDWTASLGSGAQELVTSLFPIVLFLAGISLGFYLVNKILNLVSPKNDRGWFSSGGFEQDKSLTEADKKYYRKKYK